MPGVDLNRVRAEITMEPVLGLLGFQPSRQSGVQWYGSCPLHERRGAVVVAGRRRTKRSAATSAIAATATVTSSSRERVPRGCLGVKRQLISPIGLSVTFLGWRW